MKKALLLVPLAAALFACRSQPPEVVVVTATQRPETSTPTSTEEPTATRTPRPTNTPLPPTPTPQPTFPAVDIGDIEAALRDGGYRRFPFTDGEGVRGYYWVKSNAYEQVTTWEHGRIAIQVLHDRASATRSRHMEGHLQNLDGALPEGFMAGLRLAYAAYNQAVPSSVTGEPEDVTAFNDSWNTVRGVYNIDGTEIGGYLVEFSLIWLQATCPPEYICGYANFPGLEFLGDSSLTWQTIRIWPPQAEGLPTFTGQRSRVRKITETLSISGSSGRVLSATAAGANGID